MVVQFAVIENIRGENKNIIALKAIIITLPPKSSFPLHPSTAVGQNGESVLTSDKKLSMASKRPPKLTPKRGSISTKRKVATTTDIVVNPFPAHSMTTASSSGPVAVYLINETADRHTRAQPPRLLLT